MAEQVMTNSASRQLLAGDNWSVVEWEADSDEGRILQVLVPLPFSLRWVNAYMLQDGDDWTIVDPGLNTDAARQVWNEVTSGLSLTYRNIKRIVLTHYHPDHLGVAGWMQERSGAAVYLSEIGKRHMEMLWGEEQQMTDVMSELFREHGASELHTRQLKEHMDSFMPFVHPLPEVTLLHALDVMHMGNRSWVVLETAGHAPGHMSFYCEAHQLLIAGDHVLPQITPNVSLMPNSDPDPLLHYMEGLDALAQLKVRLAFPGHRHPFRHIASRMEGIKQHHEERLAAWQRWLAEAPATAYEICSRAFGTVGKLTVHQFRFAMGETLAHLRELERRGIIARRRALSAQVESAASPSRADGPRARKARRLRRLAASPGHERAKCTASAARPRCPAVPLGSRALKTRRPRRLAASPGLERAKCAASAARPRCPAVPPGHADGPRARRRRRAEQGVMIWYTK